MKSWANWFKRGKLESISAQGTVVEGHLQNLKLTVSHPKMCPYLELAHPRHREGVRIR